MKKKKSFPRVTAVLAVLVAVSCLLNQGCGSPQGPAGPAAAAGPTPTPIPKDVAFDISNAASGTTVWEIVTLNATNGLSNYAYCSVAGGTSQAVRIFLPSGNGSYQVTINCNVNGYCRKAVLGPVSLAVGSSYNVTVSPAGSVAVGSVTCPAMAGC